MKSPIDPEKSFGTIMMEGEDDRSPEFKGVRDQLVGEVNNWLATLALKRDIRQSLPDGTRIADTSCITRTILGKTAAGFLRRAEEGQVGISLTGDGITAHYELHAVLPSEDEKIVATLEAKGSDPVERMFTGGEYAPGQNVVDASFTVTSLEGEGQPQYFGYDVRGDGSVRFRYLSEDGCHTSLPLRAPEDVQQARETFSRLTACFEG